MFQLLTKRFYLQKLQPPHEYFIINNTSISCYGIFELIMNEGLSSMDANDTAVYYARRAILYLHMQ